MTDLEQLARETAMKWCTARQEPDFIGNLAKLILTALRQAVEPLEDALDMMRDEFHRINALQGISKDWTLAGEIRALCERAQKVVEQKVPAVVQRDRLQQQLAARDELLQDMGKLLPEASDYLVDFTLPDGSPEPDVEELRNTIRAILTRYEALMKETK